jgi:hypothetical protein
LLRSLLAFSVYMIWPSSVCIHDLSISYAPPLFVAPLNSRSGFVFIWIGLVIFTRLWGEREEVGDGRACGDAERTTALCET